MGMFVNPDNSAFQSALNAKSILDEEKLIWLSLIHISVDSSEMAFKMAATLAFKKAFMEANPVLLEPVSYTHLDVYKRQTPGCGDRHGTGYGKDFNDGFPAEFQCESRRCCLLYTSRCV